MKNLIKNNQGFTLVEIMIVVLIIGILAAMALPIFDGAITQAQLSEVNSATNILKIGLSQYYEFHKKVYKKLIGKDINYINQKLRIKIPESSNFSYDVAPYPAEKNGDINKHSAGFVVRATLTEAGSSEFNVAQGKRAYYIYPLSNRPVDQDRDSGFHEDWEKGWNDSEFFVDGIDVQEQVNEVNGMQVDWGTSK